MDQAARTNAIKEAKDSSGGVYITPRTDGGRVTGVILGAPHRFLKAWQDGPARPRWAINLFEVGAGRVGVVEMSNRHFLQCAPLLRKYAEKVVSIVRNGLGTDTSYVVEFERDPTPDERTALGTAKPQDLAALTAPSSSGAKVADPSWVKAEGEI